MVTRTKLEVAPEAPPTAPGLQGTLYIEYMDAPEQWKIEFASALGISDVSQRADELRIFSKLMAGLRLILWKAEYWPMPANQLAALLDIQKHVKALTESIHRFQGLGVPYQGMLPEADAFLKQLEVFDAWLNARWTQIKKTPESVPVRADGRGGARNAAIKQAREYAKEALGTFYDMRTFTDARYVQEDRHPRISLLNEKVREEYQQAVEGGQLTEDELKSARKAAELHYAQYSAEREQFVTWAISTTNLIPNPVNRPTADN